jgi:hypothetical protein
VTHPFHPLRGQEFEMVGFAHTWGEQRVFFRKPGERQVRSLPAAWTDVVGPDIFVAQAAGRSLFRVDDLLTLCNLVGELGQRAC